MLWVLLANFSLVWLFTMCRLSCQKLSTAPGILGIVVPFP
jgi:hypothetical protein